MSVIGIDFGSDSCYVAANVGKVIETLSNEYSLRGTPSYIAFDNKRRLIGVVAKDQHLNNYKNTVFDFKRMLAHRYDDHKLQKIFDIMFAMPTSDANGDLKFQMKYLEKDSEFSPIQLTAMLLTKLKQGASNELQSEIKNCVLTCPFYFTSLQRKALLDAAQIARLNVLRLINETTATAVCYGFYKTDLEPNQKINVVFIDFGYGSLQASLCEITQTGLRVIATAWDLIGGRDFDLMLVQHYRNYIKEHHDYDIKQDKRAFLRLLNSCEVLKKKMSATNTKLNMYIECLIRDEDFTANMCRQEMEKLCEPLFKCIETTFEKLLTLSKIPTEEIHSVEIVGGSTRIPAVKSLIEKVFQKPCSTTLNQEESVARGAAIQCAILSPMKRSRNFTVTDIQNFNVNVMWDDDKDYNNGEIEIFPAMHSVPYNRQLSLTRRGPFTLTLNYSEEVPFSHKMIGKWYIKDVESNELGDEVNFKMKMRINANGIINMVMVVSSSPSETSEAETTQHLNIDENCKIGDDKSKNAAKIIELPIESEMKSLSMTDLFELLQREDHMHNTDIRETQRIDAKNSLEEYIYNARSNLQGGSLEMYVSLDDRIEICNYLDELEEWLYDEGKDSDHETFSCKLENLIQKIDPIKERQCKYQFCESLFDDFSDMIEAANEAFMAHSADDIINADMPTTSKAKPTILMYRPKENLTEIEYMNIHESICKAQKWHKDKYDIFLNLSRHREPTINADEIQQEIETFLSCVNSLMTNPQQHQQSNANKQCTSSSVGTSTDREENSKSEMDN